ncbi:MAG: translocation/assembly module TamB domain-containing protein [Pseudomonadota bacterium]
MKRGKWLRRVSWTVIGLLVFLITLVWLLLGTAPGARLVLAQVFDRTGSLVTVERIEGSFLGGLTLSGVDIASGETDVRVRSAYLEVSSRILFDFRQVLVHAIDLDGVEITLPESEKPDRATPISDVIIPELPKIELPIEVLVRRFLVKNGVVKQDAAPVFEWDRFSFSGDLKSGEVHRLDLGLYTDSYTLFVRGDCELGGALQHDLSVGVLLAPRDRMPRVALQLNGSRERIELDGAINNLFDADLNGFLTLPVKQPATGVLALESQSGSFSRDGRGVSWRDFGVSVEGRLTEWRSTGASFFSADIAPAAQLHWTIAGASHTIYVEDLVFEPVSGGRAQASGEYDWIAKHVVGALAASLNQSDIDVTGDWSIVNGGELRGSLSVGDVGALLPGASGSGTATFEVSGTVDAFSAEADVKIPNLNLFGAIVDTASVDLSVDRSGEVDAALLANRLVYQDRSIDDLELRIEGTEELHDIALSAAGGTGFDSLSLIAQGRLEDRAVWNGSLEALSVLVEPGRMDSLSLKLQAPTRLQISSDSFSWEAGCIAVDVYGELCATAGWDDGEFETFEVRSDRFDLGILPTLDDSPRLEGAISVVADLSGTVSQPSGTLEASLIDAGIALLDEQERIEIDRGELAAEWQSGALEARALVSSVGSSTLRGRVTTESWLESTQPISGEIVFELPQLNVWDGLTADVRSLEGSVYGVLSVAGSAVAPRVDADIRLQDAAAEIVPLNIEVDGLSASVKGDPFDVLDATVFGSSGDGSARFAGQLGLVGGTPFINGNLTAEDALLVDLDALRLKASSDLSINWHPSSIAVRGRAEIADSSVVVRSLPESAVVVSPDAVIVRDDDDDLLEEQRFQHIDVALALGDRVSLAGFGLKTDVTGALRIRQFSEGEPQANGRLTLRDASYAAYGQTLNVTRGTLDFNGSIDSPVLSLRAERDIDMGRVGIDIDGTPDALTSELFSEPERTDAEKLSLLLTGRSLSDTETDDGVSLADAAITLGLKRAFGVSDAIRSSVGLDELSVDGSGSDGRILAGKQLSKRIYLQYAYGVFDQLSNVLLRFQINDRLALESVSGEEQAFDLIYQVGGEQ